MTKFSTPWRLVDYKIQQCPTIHGRCGTKPTVFLVFRAPRTRIINSVTVRKVHDCSPAGALCGTHRHWGAAERPHVTLPHRGKVGAAGSWFSVAYHDSISARNLVPWPPTECSNRDHNSNFVLWKTPSFQWTLNSCHLFRVFALHLVGTRLSPFLSLRPLMKTKTFLLCQGVPMTFQCLAVCEWQLPRCDFIQ